VPIGKTPDFSPVVGAAVSKDRRYKRQTEALDELDDKLCEDRTLDGLLELWDELLELDDLVACVELELLDDLVASVEALDALE